MEFKDKKTNNVVISEDVIAKVASIAACDVAGVADVVEKPYNFSGIFKDRAANSVTINIMGKSAIIDIYVKLNEGFKVQNVAEYVQKAVKEQVQNMTGTVVTKVNVHVCDIELKTEEDNQEQDA